MDLQVLLTTLLSCCFQKALNCKSVIKVFLSDIQPAQSAGIQHLYRLFFYWKNARGRLMQVVLFFPSGFGDLKSKVFWSVHIIFMKALELLGCCSMKHTLFYFGYYRGPKTCGYIAVRLYSKHFRNLDQVVFFTRTTELDGKSWMVLFPLPPTSSFFLLLETMFVIWMCAVIGCSATQSPWDLLHTRL